MALSESEDFLCTVVKVRVDQALLMQNASSSNRLITVNSNTKYDEFEQSLSVPVAQLLEKEDIVRCQTQPAETSLARSIHIVEANDEGEVVQYSKDGCAVIESKRCDFVVLKPDILSQFTGTTVGLLSQCLPANSFVRFRARLLEEDNEEPLYGQDGEDAVCWKVVQVLEIVKPEVETAEIEEVPAHVVGENVQPVPPDLDEHIGAMSINDPSAIRAKNEGEIEMKGIVMDSTVHSLASIMLENGNTAVCCLNCLHKGSLDPATSIAVINGGLLPLVGQQVSVYLNSETGDGNGNAISLMWLAEDVLERGSEGSSEVIEQENNDQEHRLGLQRDDAGPRRLTGIGRSRPVQRTQNANMGDRSAPGGGSRSSPVQTGGLASHASPPTLPPSDAPSLAASDDCDFVGVQLNHAEFITGSTADSQTNLDPPLVSYPAARPLDGGAGDRTSGAADPRNTLGFGRGRSLRKSQTPLEQRPSRSLAEVGPVAPNEKYFVGPSASTTATYPTTSINLGSEGIEPSMDNVQFVTGQELSNNASFESPSTGTGAAAAVDGIACQTDYDTKLFYQSLKVAEVALNLLPKEQLEKMRRLCPTLISAYEQHVQQEQMNI